LLTFIFINHTYFFIHSHGLFSQAWTLFKALARLADPRTFSNAQLRHLAYEALDSFAAAIAECIVEGHLASIQAMDDGPGSGGYVDDDDDDGALAVTGLPAGADAAVTGRYSRSLFRLLVRQFLEGLRPGQSDAEGVYASNVSLSIRALGRFAEPIGAIMGRSELVRLADDMLFQSDGVCSGVLDGTAASRVETHIPSFLMAFAGIVTAMSTPQQPGGAAGSLDPHLLSSLERLTGASLQLFSSLLTPSRRALAEGLCALFCSLIHADAQSSSGGGNHVVSGAGGE
jgi:hypothetical protein